MKKLLAVITAAAIVAMAGSAMAATANLSVSAHITAACSVTGGTLNFGELDALAAPLVTATSTGVSVTCTKNANYSVGTDHGLHSSGGGTQANLSNGTDSIPYSVSVGTLPAADGTAHSVTLSGTIAATSYTGVSSGTYNDTMVITVNP